MEVLTKRTLTEIGPDSVVLTEGETGRQVRRGADAVVLATGVRPGQALADALRKEFAHTVLVGDGATSAARLPAPYGRPTTRRIFSERPDAGTTRPPCGRSEQGE